MAQAIKLALAAERLLPGVTETLRVGDQAGGAPVAQVAREPEAAPGITLPGGPATAEELARVNMLRQLGLPPGSPTAEPLTPEAPPGSLPPIRFDEFGNPTGLPQAAAVRPSPAGAALAAQRAGERADLGVRAPATAIAPSGGVLDTLSRLLPGQTTRDLIGLVPIVSQLLGLPPEVGVGSQTLNLAIKALDPTTLRALAGTLSGAPGALRGGLSTGAGLAGGAAGIASQFVKDPTTRFALGAGGQALSLGAQVPALFQGGLAAALGGAATPIAAAPVATGIAGAAGAAGAGTTAAASAAPAATGFGAAGLALAPVAVIALMKTVFDFLRAGEEARERKQNVERFKQFTEKFQRDLPAIKDAGQRFLAGDTSGFPVLVNAIRTLNTASESIVGFSAGNARSQINNASKQLFGVLQQNQDLYRKAFDELARQASFMPGAAPLGTEGYLSYAKLGTGQLAQYIPPPPEGITLPAVRAESVPTISGVVQQVPPDPFAAYRPAGPKFVEINGQRLPVGPTGAVRVPQLSYPTISGPSPSFREVPFAQAGGKLIYAPGESPEEIAAAKAAKETAATQARQQATDEERRRREVSLEPFLPELSQIVGQSVTASHVLQASDLARQQSIPIEDTRFIDLLRGVVSPQVSQATPPSAAAPSPDTAVAATSGQQQPTVTAPLATAPIPPKPIGSLRKGGVVGQTGTYRLHSGELVVRPELAPAVEMFLNRDTGVFEPEDTIRPGFEPTGRPPASLFPGRRMDVESLSDAAPVHQQLDPYYLTRQAMFEDTGEMPPAPDELLSRGETDFPGRPMTEQEVLEAMFAAPAATAGLGGGAGSAVANVYEERSRPRPGQPPFGPLTPGGPGRRASDVGQGVRPGLRTAQAEIPPEAAALPYFVNPKSGAPFQAKMNPDPSTIWRLVFDENQLQQAWEERGKFGWPLLVRKQDLDHPMWRAALEFARTEQYVNPNVVVDLRRLAKPEIPPEQQIPDEMMARFGQVTGDTGIAPGFTPGPESEALAAEVPTAEILREQFAPAGR